MTKTIDQYVEFRIFGVHEPPDGGTQRYEKTGRGNGQEEYAKLKYSHPDDELQIQTREVVMVFTNWKPVLPDEECTGSGYSHKAHGKCRGYATDRT